jgi:hypothetical protein
LADGASVDVVSGELGKAWPPIFSGDEFVGFPSAGVAYGGMIVVHFDQVASEGIIFRDVDVSSVEDDSIFEVPVF